MSGIAEDLCLSKYVGPFINSTREVFKTMLGSQCRFDVMEKVDLNEHLKEYTAMISMDGVIRGGLAVSIDRQCVLSICNILTFDESDLVTPLAFDSLGEILNMIAGRGKRDLAQYELRLGLPAVFHGKRSEEKTTRWKYHRWIPFQSEIGKGVLEIGFDLDNIGF